MYILSRMISLQKFLLTENKAMQGGIVTENKIRINESHPFKILFASSQHKLAFVHSSVKTIWVDWLITDPANLPSRVTPAI